MKLNYRIVEIHPEDHLVVVRYWTDKLSEEDLASGPERNEEGKLLRCRSDVSISIPIPEPDKEELHKLFMFNAPVAGLKTLEEVRDPTVDTSMINVTSLSIESHEVDVADIPNILKGVPTDAQIEAAVAAAGK